jgi:hypothetical protein
MIGACLDPAAPKIRATEVLKCAIRAPGSLVRRQATARPDVERDSGRPQGGPPAIRPSCLRPPDLVPPDLAAHASTASKSRPGPVEREAISDARAVPGGSLDRGERVEHTSAAQRSSLQTQTCEIPAADRISR